MEEQTVYIVDDDSAVRDSVRELVESVGLHAETHSSAQAFLESLRPERPGCLVLDVRMGGMSGLVLQEKLHELGAQIPVIILTGHGDVPMAVCAMKSGAFDFIQKPYRDQLLLDSINSALAADVNRQRAFATRTEFADNLTALTEREREVFDKLLEGSSSKQIAKELGISHRTVEAHRQGILKKYEVASVKELICLLVSSEHGG